MNVHVGCGGHPLPGFVNVDPFYTDHPEVLAGDAANLPIEDGSADLIFSNAVFEHVFLGHHLPTLTHWQQKLAPDGVVACIGIPDFARVAFLYLAKSPGITGERFDLFEAYRYVHGWAEGDTQETAWLNWQVSENPDMAPAGWLPQAHKAIFDSDYLNALIERSGLEGTVFTYAYPDEPPLNLGFVAAHNPVSVDALERVPNLNRWVVPGSVTPQPKKDESRMAAFSLWAATGVKTTK